MVSKVPSPHMWFLHAKQRLWTKITSLYWSQTSPVALYMQNCVFSTLITSLYDSLPSSVGFACTSPVIFWVQNNAICTGITCFCGSQTSPVVLCIELQNSVPSIRFTSLYASPPSSVDFECKTLSFGTEFYVSMGPRPHLLLYGCKTT